MVNRSNVIPGRNIDRHPLEGEQPLGIYLKGATVIAGQAQISGVVQTPEGEMTFQPGDYIATDNPPTHAWPIRQQVFETTYEIYESLSPLESPRGPEPKPDYVPALSVPPVDSASIKAADGEATPAVEVPLIEATPEVPDISVNQKGRKGRTADSSSLPFAGQDPGK